MHTKCCCVCVLRTSEGLELCRPPRWLSPWRWLQKQGRKYVSAARHTRIVERFLYGWLEYERICQGWITQAQQVILDNFNLASRVPKASSSLWKIHFVTEGGGDLTDKTGGPRWRSLSISKKMGHKKMVASSFKETTLMISPPLVS